MHKKPLPIYDWRCDGKKGLVRSLLTDDGEVEIASWGCEFGDWVGTFAQHKMGGINSNILYKDINLESDILSCQFRVELPRGRFSLKGEDKLAKGIIQREYVLRAETESALGDFVVRHAISCADCPEAQISGHIYSHKGHNHRFQYQVSKVDLFSKTIQISSEATEYIGPESLDRVSYVRDEQPNRWVVHHRFIASRNKSQEYVFRFRNYTAIWKNKGFQGWLGRGPLWCFSERHSWMRPTTQSCGLILLQPGEEVIIRTRLSCYSPQG